ncbi:MAG: SPOR domain-containing protein, partial [Alphaproteobacteria bacterium]
MQQQSADSHPDSGAGARFGRWAGAVLSVGIIVAVGMWTYRLGQRDAMAVPVIQALEGPARTQPDDPGGLRADHQGLTVTQVIAGTPPQPRPGEVRTAPAPEELAPEDLPAAALLHPPATAAAPSSAPG